MMPRKFIFWFTIGISIVCLAGAGGYWLALNTAAAAAPLVDDLLSKNVTVEIRTSTDRDEDEEGRDLDKRDALLHAFVEAPFDPACESHRSSAAVQSTASGTIESVVARMWRAATARQKSKDDKRQQSTENRVPQGQVAVWETPRSVLQRATQFGACVLRPSAALMSSTAIQRAWWPSLSLPDTHKHSLCQQLESDLLNASRSDSVWRDAHRTASLDVGRIGAGACLRATDPGKPAVDHAEARLSLFSSAAQCRAARDWRNTPSFRFVDGELAVQLTHCWTAPLPALPVLVHARNGVLVDNFRLLRPSEVFAPESADFYTSQRASSRVYDNDREALLLCQKNESACEIPRVEVALSAHGPWANGVFHWHVEVMPRLVPVLRLFSDNFAHDPTGLHVIVEPAANERRASYRNKWLRFWGVREDQVLEEPRVFAREAWSVGAGRLGRHPLHSHHWLLRMQRESALARARQLAPGAFASSDERPYILLLVREDPNSNGRQDAPTMRAVESELRAAMRGNASAVDADVRIFSDADQALMGDIARQIGLVSGASAVVATQGAGAASMLYCAEGTPVIVRDYDEHVFFVELAMLVGLRYHTVAPWAKAGDLARLALDMISNQP